MNYLFSPSELDYMPMKCERCYYIAKQKGDYKKHLNRKNPCKPIHSTISIKELLEKLNKQKELNSNMRLK